MKGIAEETGRPYIYLEPAITKKKGQSKEEFANSIAAKDRVTEGLVCVLATVEACRSFGVRKNHKTHKARILPLIPSVNKSSAAAQVSNILV